MKTKIYLLVFSIGILIACDNTKRKPETQAKVEVKQQVKQDTQTLTKVEFPSLDGVTVVANLYQISEEAPVIVLCHQARYNKFEYNDIAPKLNKLGFNCLAIDQRSGGQLSNHDNETHLNATKQGKLTDYIDAEQDIIAAVNFAADKYKQPVILWGSSYSSTLALYIANENKNVKAVVSFSPGNYLAKYKGSLIDVIPSIKAPVFITSSKSEANTVKNSLLKKSKLGANLVFFEPKEKGYHGSKALWESQPGGEEYWVAIKRFLEKVK